VYGVCVWCVGVVCVVCECGVCGVWVWCIWYVWCVCVLWYVCGVCGMCVSVCVHVCVACMYVWCMYVYDVYVVCMVWAALRKAGSQVASSGVECGQRWAAAQRGLRNAVRSGRRRESRALGQLAPP